MISLEDKLKILKCLPRCSITTLDEPQHEGCNSVRAFMLFLLGPTSTVYYPSVERAISGSYEQLRYRVWRECMNIEQEIHGVWNE